MTIIVIKIQNSGKQHIIDTAKIVKIIKVPTAPKTELIIHMADGKIITARHDSFLLPEHFDLLIGM